MTLEQRLAYAEKDRARQVAKYRALSPGNRAARLRQMQAYNKTRNALSRDHMRHYGISLDERDEILELQGNCCAICKRTTPCGKGGWHTDHDHVTGRVRGVLCHYCNVGIGSLQDSVKILENALIYLRSK